MLYFYKSISPHPIENLHNYLDFFFTRMFDDTQTVYSHGYLIHPDFQDIIDNYKTQIDVKLEALFNAYIALPTPQDKNKVKDAYTNNNNVEGVCNNVIMPYKYEDLHESIRKEVKELYNSEGVLYNMLTSKTAYKLLKDKCGDLITHFNTFRNLNKTSVCPFCGMESLLPINDKAKNDYDHYISKGKYPFCSVNFHNLVPTCGNCNKAPNKGQKDIPYNVKVNPIIREEVFYPYSNIDNHEIILSIISPDTNLDDLNNWNLQIDCTPTINSTRKERWMEIYDIEYRYKTKIAGDNYDWKQMIVDEYHRKCKKRGETFDTFKEDILAIFKDYLKHNNGILRKTFNEFIMNDPDCEAKLSGKFVI
ncbi:hypothetical protein [Chryseobacterium pennipullorum]|nr:hypothetical protein [Chryseobacterium pennipullorum]